MPDFKVTVGPDSADSAPCRPALRIDRDWIQRHMRIRHLHVDTDTRCHSAQAHRTDSQLIYHLQQLLLEAGDLGIRMVRPERPRNRVLGKSRAEISRPANSNSDDRRRAGIAPRIEDRL